MKVGDAVLRVGVNYGQVAALVVGGERCVMC